MTSEMLPRSLFISVFVAVFTLDCISGLLNSGRDPSRIFGEMSVTHTYVRSGDFLVVNCSLLDLGWNNQTADDIYFVIGPNRLDNFTKVIDDNVAQLRWPTRRHISQAHLQCYVDDYLQQYHHLQQHDPLPELIDQATFTVADPPLTPSLESCVVYNWERMECTWLPANQDRHAGIKTEQTLKYTIKDGAGVSACVDVRANTCVLRSGNGANSLRISSQYDLYIEAKNALGTSLSPVVSIHPKMLVKPDPVGRLSVRILSNTSALLSWKSPVKSFIPGDILLIYQITASPLMPNISQEITELISKDVLVFNTSSLSQNISGLYPYTQYKFSVRVIPTIYGMKAGFWSNTTSVTGTTLEGVPGALPQFTPGSYSYVSTNEKTRKVDVYWKRIPSHLLQGEIIGYRVRYSVLTPPYKTSFAVVELYEAGDHMKNMMCVELEARVDYSLTVEARTRIGYNSLLSPSPLIIPAVDTGTAGVNEIVAIGDMELVNVTWQPVHQAIGYTVYWCNSQSTHHRCTDDLQWERLGSDLTRFSIEVSDSQFDKYLVAVSTEYYSSIETGSNLNQSQPEAMKMSASRPVMSSGMTWAECVFSTRNVVLPPSEVELSELQHTRSISLTWKRPKCQHSAYYSMFIVLYCDSDTCQEKGWQNITIPRNAMSFTLKDLNGGHNYKLKMASLSPTTMSQYSPVISTHVKAPWAMPLWGSVLLAVAAVILFCLIAAGIASVRRKCTKGWKDYTSVAITLPGKSVKETNNTSKTWDETLQMSDNRQYFIGDTCAGTDIQNEENNMKEKVWINGELTFVAFSPGVESSDSARTRANGYSSSDERNSLLTECPTANSHAHSDVPLPSLPATDEQTSTHNTDSSGESPSSVTVRDEQENPDQQTSTSAYSTLDEITGASNTQSMYDSSVFSSISPYTVVDCAKLQSIRSSSTSSHSSTADDDNSCYVGSPLFISAKSAEEDDKQQDSDKEYLLSGEASPVTDKVGEMRGPPVGRLLSSSGGSCHEEQNDPASEVSPWSPSAEVNSPFTVSSFWKEVPESLITSPSEQLQAAQTQTYDKCDVSDLTGSCQSDAGAKLLRSNFVGDGIITLPQSCRNMCEADEQMMCSLSAGNYHDPLPEIANDRSCSGYVSHDVIGQLVS